MKVIIDNKIYVCEKAKFELSKFNHEGVCDKYKNISYVVIDDDIKRVRQFHSIFDENNKRSGFDPYNYSDDSILVRLSGGDECYIEDLYKITATSNNTGEIYIDYLNETFIYEDLKKLPSVNDTIELNDISPKILKIKNDYIKLESEWKEIENKYGKVASLIRVILDAEPDINKRKNIIDFVYENKVEELHEHSMRKRYLSDEK